MLINGLKKALAGIAFAGLPLVAAAQERRGAANEPPPQWVETRFHRVHLKNGNFVDGMLVSKDPRTVVLRMNPGNFAIRTDMIARVEYVKMRSIQEEHKLEDIKKETRLDGPPAVADAGRRPPAGDAPPVAAVDTGDIGAQLSRESPERRPALLRELMEGKGSEGPAFMAALIERVAPDIRPEIVGLLIEKEASAAVPTLVKLLQNQDPGVREQALKSIHGVGDSGVLSRVDPSLSDPDPLVRAAALTIFEKFGSEGDFSKIAGRLKDPDGGVRGTALSSLQSFSKRLEMKTELVETLRAAVEDGDPETGAAIVGILGKMNDKELAPELARFAENPDAKIRANAIAGLVTTDTVEAAKVILARIEVEGEYWPRIAIADGCRKLRLKAATEPLIQWLQDESVDIRSAAGRALRDVTGQQNLGSDYDRWSAWWETAKPK